MHSFVFGLIQVVRNLPGSIGPVLMGSFELCYGLGHWACPLLGCINRPQLPSRCACFRLFSLVQCCGLYYSCVACIVLYLLALVMPQEPSQAFPLPFPLFSLFWVEGVKSRPAAPFSAPSHLGHTIWLSPRRPLPPSPSFSHLLLFSSSSSTPHRGTLSLSPFLFVFACSCFYAYRIPN